MKNLSIIFLLWTSILFPKDHTIAVLDFYGEGIHSDELKSLSASFRIELLKMDSLIVLDYEEMRAILKQANRENSSCSTFDCEVINAMLLNQEWMVSVNVSKIGDVFICEGRLFESKTGRVINAVSYDHELSLEGLYSQGMSNLAVLIMSKRIPLDVHKNKDLVFIRSEPAGAMVRVGKDTLINDTPIALSRVVVESKPIVLLKDGYQPFFVKRLPDDYTDVIFVKLKRTIPQIGDVAFKSPIPGGISIVSDNGQDSFLIPEGSSDFKELSAGKYSLTSEDYVILNNDFKINHKRTVLINPRFYLIDDIVKRKDSFEKKRNLFIGILGGGLAYRSYLSLQSNRLYSDYGDNINSADSRHQAIDNLDNQKPAVEIVSGFMIFPIIYYYSKQLEMERWLKR